MSLTGEPDGLPQKVWRCAGRRPVRRAVRLHRHSRGVRHRDATGQGQQIDIGMLDTHVAWLANQGMNYLATSENPEQVRQSAPEHRAISGFSDRGRTHRAVGRNDPTFKRFCEAFALTHLLEDARFATNAARVENRQLVTDTLTPVMRQHPTAWWAERLEALKIGCGAINKLSEVFADPHVVARRWWCGWRTDRVRR